MSGDLLWGSSAMQFVFVDEAGTSENEPVTIVAGLIVNADEQLMFAEGAIDEALGAVPKIIRDAGFLFHATAIWSDKRYREHWAQADRLAFLDAMMSLPRRLNFPLSFGLVRRNAPDGKTWPSMSLAQSHHVMAFGFCLSRADKHIREHCGLNEVATVVAEDVPEM